ncbi:hypothetical protein [Halosegnis sp.]|uniref:DUF5789 family protein n=1 Tax=Halosegnis sp. TaxID=2864959 RepID=UPI0035D4FE68
MGREQKLSRLSSLLAEAEYPVDRATLADEFDDVTLLLADGEASLAELVRGLQSDSFSDAGDLETELYGALPTEAVGEPGQSEGEG